VACSDRVLDVRIRPHFLKLVVERRADVLPGLGERDDSIHALRVHGDAVVHGLATAPTSAEVHRPVVAAEPDLGAHVSLREHNAARQQEADDRDREVEARQCSALVEVGDEAFDGRLVDPRRDDAGICSRAGERRADGRPGKYCASTSFSPASVIAAGSARSS